MVHFIFYQPTQRMWYFRNFDMNPTRIWGFFIPPDRDRGIFIVNLQLLLTLSVNTTEILFVNATGNEGSLTFHDIDCKHHLE